MIKSLSNKRIAIITLLLFVFSFGKIYASNDEIHFGDTVNPSTYTAVALVQDPYSTGDLDSYNDSTWYSANGNSGVITDTFFILSNIPPDYTGYMRLWFTAGHWTESVTDSQYIEFYVNNGSIGSFDYTTRINTISPYDKQVIATSTSHTISETGYVNGNDFKLDNTFLKIRLQSIPSPFQKIENTTTYLPFKESIDNYGSFSISSTTYEDLPVGKYFLTSEIEAGSYCLFGYCLYQNTLYSTSTSFIVATSTAGDIITDNIINNLKILTDEDCSITSFKFFTCMSELGTLLIYPNPDTLSYTVNQAKTGFLSHVPVGYLTRFVSILTGTTTSNLPAFTAPIRIGQSTTTDTLYLTYDMNDMVAGAGTLLEGTRDPYTGKNFKDIFYPIVQLIVASGVLLAIIKDITGSHKHNSDLPKGKNI